MSQSASPLHLVGGDAPPGADRVVAALGSGSSLVAVTGPAAAPSSATDVTDSVVGLIDALQAVSAEAAALQRGADVVVAVLTPQGVDPDDLPWRRALDEAVSGVTQSLAREYVPEVLRVNAVLAGADGLDDVARTVEFLTHDVGSFTLGATVDIRAEVPQ